MKKTLFILSMSVVTLFSCKKDEADCPEITQMAPAGEVTNLRNYLQTNNITAVEDPRGFFYREVIAGSGPKPTPCSGVTVNYIGTYTDGEVLDQANNVYFKLSGSIITGWKEGVPHISKGGTTYLYLPPSFGYGSNPPPGVRANAIMIFKIELKEVY